MNLPAPRRASPAQIENAMKLFGQAPDFAATADNFAATADNIAEEEEEEISLESILRDKPKAKIVREFIKENLPCDSDDE